MSNYIKQLENEVAALSKALKNAESELDLFIAFLHSPKFSGVESDGSRKDWIATGDVISRMRELKNALNPEIEIVSYKNKLEKQREELRPIFDSVCNRDDWKAPIYCYRKLSEMPAGTTVEKIKDAIQFFCAVESTITHVQGDLYKIESIGYRAGPAGDH